MEPLTQEIHLQKEEESCYDSKIEALVRLLARQAAKDVYLIDKEKDSINE